MTIWYQEHKFFYISQTTLKLRNFSFFLYEPILMPELKKIKNVNNIKTHIFHKMKYDHLYANFFSTFVNGPILIKIYINANIMKTQFFHKPWPVTFMLWRSFVVFLTLSPYDLIKIDFRFYGLSSFSINFNIFVNMVLANILLRN